MPRSARHNVEEGWIKEPIRGLGVAYRGCGYATTPGYLLSPLRGEDSSTSQLNGEGRSAAIPAYSLSARRAARQGKWRRDGARGTEVSHLRRSWKEGREDVGGRSTPGLHPGLVTIAVLRREERR